MGKWSYRFGSAAKVYKVDMINLGLQPAKPSPSFTNKDIIAYLDIGCFKDQIGEVLKQYQAVSEICE